MKVIAIVGSPRKGGNCDTLVTKMVEKIDNIYIEKPNETLKELFGTDEDMLARDYVIINHDKILMWIKEVFPISYFTEI